MRPVLHRWWNGRRAATVRAAGLSREDWKIS
jgi:hypothetical protein